jgi:hypothetical protein
MATIRIEIETDNAAFEEAFGIEVREVLEAAAQMVCRWKRGENESTYPRETESSLRDSNGNTVGKVEVVD